MEWPRMVVRGTTSNHASVPVGRMGSTGDRAAREPRRSEEHTSELQSRLHLVCRLLLEKKKNNNHHAGTKPLLRTSPSRSTMSSAADTCSCVSAPLVRRHRVPASAYCLLCSDISVHTFT